MQTQDGPAEFLFKLWPKLEQNKNMLIGVAVAIAVAAVAAYYVSSSHAQNRIDAGNAVTMLLVNTPAGTSESQRASSLGVLAAKYAGTPSGDRAGLQAAGALFEAGSYTEAQAQFQKFLDASPTGPLAAEAALGIASCLEAQNKLDLAVPAYKRVVSSFAGTSYVAQAYLALGRIAEQQNNLPEAMTQYENAARESMQNSSTRMEASQHAMELQARTAATASKAPMVSKPVTNAMQPAVKH